MFTTKVGPRKVLIKLANLIFGLDVEAILMV